MIDLRVVSSNPVSLCGNERNRLCAEQERRGVKRDWSADEFVEYWTLLPGEKQCLARKTGPMRLGFAVLLKVFQHEGCFPLDSPERRFLAAGSQELAR